MMAQKRWLGAALLALLMLAAFPAGAQEGNLLQQGGFDDGYTGRGRGDLNIPGAWGLWTLQGPTDQFINRADKMYAFPHRPEPQKRSGAAALNLNGGYVTFTAAVYQQVSVPEGSNVRGSAWAYLHTCNPGGNGTCSSTDEFGAYVKIGIDPNGGTDANDADLVWSSEVRPHDRYEQLTVEATATGSVVTLFLYVTQSRPPGLNNVYWDDASLVLGGGGGAAPGGQGGSSGGPTPYPTAPVPVRQDEQADGSLVHVIQPGDTIDGLAYIYGTTRAAILELNPDLNPRLLQLGQEVIVRRGGDTTPTRTPARTRTPTPTPTRARS